MSFHEFLHAGAFAIDRPGRLPLSAFTAAAAAPVFVEVGGQSVEANITREGTKVPSVTLNDAVLSDLLTSVVVKPRLKVVRQSIEAGRAAERGSTVDIVLAEPADLPLTIVDGVHAGLAGRKVGEVFSEFVNPNPEVARILRTKTDLAALTTAERETVTGALAQGGVDVDPADDAAFASAFTGLQAANLFAG